MFKKKFVLSISIIVIFFIITSMVKNKTRIIEKQISNLSFKISSKEKNINEAQLDFYYLTSPLEIEKRLNVIGLDKYQPISYSKIFFGIKDLDNISNKISKLKFK